MDMDLKEGSLGSEGEYSLKLVGGKVVFELAHQSGAVAAGVKAELDPDYFIDKLAEMIPGEVDDAIFAIIKGALKA